MFVKTMTPKKMDSAQRGVSFPHACQSTSMFSHRLWYNLLMQLSSAFFFHGNALTNVSLVCGHQTGESIIMEPETWPDYMFCKQSQCSHELFNWCVRLGSHLRWSWVWNRRFLTQWYLVGCWVFDIKSIFPSFMDHACILSLNVRGRHFSTQTFADSMQSPL